MDTDSSISEVGLLNALDVFLAVNISILEKAGLTYVVYSLYFIEVIILASCTFVSLLGFYISITTTGLHKNLTIIFNFYVLNFILCNLIRFSFITYSVCSEKTILNTDIFLQIMMAARVSSTIMDGFSVPIACIERLFATLFLKDYEKRPRIYIPIVSILIAAGITSLLTISQKYNMIFKFTVLHFIIIAVIIGPIFTAIFYILWRYNHAALNSQWRFFSKKAYSLSAKYQLQENIRIFRLTHFLDDGLNSCVKSTVADNYSGVVRITEYSIALFRNVVLMIAACFCVSVGLIIGIYTTDDSVSKNLQGMFFDISVSVQPVIMVTVCIYTIDQWYTKSLSILSWNKTEKSTMHVFNNRVSPMPEGDVYFENLKLTWG